MRLPWLSANLSNECYAYCFSTVNPEFFLLADTLCVSDQVWGPCLNLLQPTSAERRNVGILVPYSRSLFPPPASRTKGTVGDNPSIDLNHLFYIYRMLGFSNKMGFDSCGSNRKWSMGASATGLIQLSRDYDRFKRGMSG